MSRRRKPVDETPWQVAVIDCGSSEIRAASAEIHGRVWRVLEDMHLELDLSEAFNKGRFDVDTMEQIERVIGDMVEAIHAYGVTRIRAVATAAFREASNADVVLERIRQELGLEIEIIDPSEEARLYYQALAWALQQEEIHLGGDTVALDIGSGSSVVSLIRRGKLVHSVDEHISTLRVLENFAELRQSYGLLHAIDRYCHGAVRVMLSRLPRIRHPHLVVTGSEVRYLGQLIFGREERLMRRFDVATIAAWYDHMQGMTPLERADYCRTDVHRADELLPVAGILRHLGQETGTSEILVPMLRLRDGLIMDHLPGSEGRMHLSRKHLLAAAKQLSVRYGMDQKYAANTARLAAQIFDQTQALHRCGARARILLEFAALVHDVGAAINVRSRHKHTFYIISQADIVGLSDLEQEVVAHVARYHRRSPPRPTHLAFQALPQDQRVLIRMLAAILRLSYALDVERCQRIRTVRSLQIGNRMVLHLDRREITLERWSVHDKSQMFEEVFGLEVVVTPLEERT